MYHFKDHNAADQYWRDIPLEVQNDSTAKTVTDFLFKEHSYYFDKDLIASKQVERLVQMIIEKNADTLRKQNIGKGVVVDNQAAPAANLNKPKAHGKLHQDLEKARHAVESTEAVFPSVPNKNSKLEPIGSAKPGKLDPIDSKGKEKNKKSKDSDDFDLLGFDDISDPKPKASTKQKEVAKEDDNFDFMFEDIDPKEGSKMPPGGNKIEKEAKSDDLLGSLLEDKPKTEEKQKESKQDSKKSSSKPEPEKDKSNNDNSKEEAEDYIIIDGKRFREIQIEGEEDEFLMDDDGNIYDKEGVYIGTAKDGAEGEEEEEDK